MLLQGIESRRHSCIVWNIKEQSEHIVHADRVPMEADPKPAVSTSVKRGRPKKLNPTGPVDYPEVCRICQEPATRHLHYGSIVCFSCKAFFRRAIQNEVHTLFTCAVENRCEMNSVSRKHCQKCRWDACLRVGMKSQWVLSKKERVKRMERRQSQGMESLPRQVGEACEATWSRDSEDQPRETSRDALESHGSTSSVQSSSPELGIPKQVSFDPTEDQFIENITKIYDQQFRSVSLGEVIIKEMIVSSLYNVPISVSSSLSAYRLMVNRVTKIANSFDTFCTFPMRIKMALLKKNADPMVLLNGATFFSESAKEQIQVSMGEDDALSSGILIDRSKEAIDKAGSISYWNWNTIQTYHSPDVEDVFSNQLKRLGTLLERNPVLLKLILTWSGSSLASLVKDFLASNQVSSPYSKIDGENYEYAYNIDHPESQYGQIEAKDGNEVVGAYEVSTNDGQQRTISYSVSEGSGFKANVTYQHPDGYMYSFHENIADPEGYGASLAHHPSSTSSSYDIVFPSSSPNYDPPVAQRQNHGEHHPQQLSSNYGPPQPYEAVSVGSSYGPPQGSVASNYGPPQQPEDPTIESHYGATHQPAQVSIESNYGTPPTQDHPAKPFVVDYMYDNEDYSNSPFVPHPQTHRRGPHRGHAKSHHNHFGRSKHQRGHHASHQHRGGYHAPPKHHRHHEYQAPLPYYKPITTTTSFPETTTFLPMTTTFPTTFPTTETTVLPTTETTTSMEETTTLLATKEASELGLNVDIKVTTILDTTTLPMETTTVSELTTTVATTTIDRSTLSLIITPSQGEIALRERLAQVALTVTQPSAQDAALAAILANPQLGELLLAQIQLEEERAKQEQTLVQVEKMVLNVTDNLLVQLKAFNSGTMAGGAEVDPILPPILQTLQLLLTAPRAQAVPQIQVSVEVEQGTNAASLVDDLEQELEDAIEEAVEEAAAASTRKRRQGNRGPRRLGESREGRDGILGRKGKPRGENSPLFHPASKTGKSNTHKAVQVASTELARTITGKSRQDHVQMADLLHLAGLPSFNELSVRASVMETWKAFRSSDGKSGGRNPLGQIIFPTLRQCQQPPDANLRHFMPSLCRNVDTLAVHAANIWNKSSALRTRAGRADNGLTSEVTSEDTLLAPNLGTWFGMSRT
eukprot:snap_masked-scaffold296_size217904-processed-gene-1.3 protein:Tk03901 transcript:snap_masked-scaffold296_size217904-processed-gene-1.3-mRNA-1 annotation:"retinoid x"